MGEKARSLYSASTELCADSVESHPYLAGVFALGTYQVDQKEVSAESRPRRGTEDVNLDRVEGKEEDADRDGYAADAATNSSSTSPPYERRGRVTLHQTCEGEDGAVRCETLEALDTPAILDMKWARFVPTSAWPGNSLVRSTLAVATAASTIRLLPLDHARRRFSHEATAWEVRLNDRNALCLSLDLSDRRAGTSARAHDAPAHAVEGDAGVAVSQSDGSIAWLPSLERALSRVPPSGESGTGLTDSGRERAGERTRAWEDEARGGEAAGRAEGDEEAPEDEEDEATQEFARLNRGYEARPRGLETWRAHDHEAWIVGFDCWSEGRICWSGGDDLKLKGWDLRMPNVAPGRQPTFTCKRGFDGGVTSLQSHRFRQHIWGVGSYDGRFRLFDARQPLRPVEELDVGGGVWRVQWHPTQSHRVLLACMHDGFKVVEVPSLGDAAAPRLPDVEAGGMHVAVRFDDHESLAYGCDWDRGESEAASAPWPRAAKKPDDVPWPKLAKRASVASLERNAAGEEVVGALCGQRQPHGKHDDDDDVAAPGTATTADLTDVVTPASSTRVHSCSFYDKRLHLWRA